MRDALRHRGPDGEGEWITPHAAIGMRRLSIIDLTGGWQPLFNEDRTVALVANGEIYNHVELRRDLESRGHRFRTHSDCETIAHLYEEHGVDFVRYLRGMFAVALFDERLQRVVLVRDRMGEKPLYLHVTADTVAFSSELKSLVSGGGIPVELDPVAVGDFFHFQYVPEPFTAIRGVRKLDAAHRMIVDLKRWTITEDCYWKMEDAPPVDGEPRDVIRAELEKIGELIIRSDVPVGVALSGGLDSSAIAALAAAKYPGTLQAFSVGYAGRPASDERADARALAEHLKLPFQEVELRSEEMIRFFPDLVSAQDDPIADISGYGYYSVMRAAREAGVPVMLQGQGGDELFWGYGWVREAERQTERLRHRQRSGALALPRYMTFKGPGWWGPRSLALWMGEAFGLKRGAAEWRRDAAKGADDSVFYEMNPESAGAGIESASWMASRLDGACAGRISSATWTRPGDGAVPAPRLLTRQICDSYLRSNGLAQGDRLGMASGVELRLPLVDYRLVETVIGLRKRRDDTSLEPKAWLRGALDGLLPEWVMNRPKRGFTPPISEWVHGLRRDHGAMLKEGRLANEGWLRRETVNRWVDEGHRGDADLWMGFKALVLEHWIQAMEKAAKTS